MNRFTEEQVIQLAPDAASLKAGKSLASELKWLSLSCNERALWGEMQGSGKDPYRTIIDLNNVAFKCSCPSRKFPCKHGLGLLLIYTQKTEVLSPAEPAWVQDWINKRQDKSENKASGETPENNPAKEEKQKKDKAKRQQDRITKVKEGVAELDLWVRDLIRTGLISLPEKGHRFFEKTAARMVDSQAPGLANMVRSLAEINFYRGTSWQSEAFEKLSAIHLLTEAFNNLESLPKDLQEDIKTMIGWPVSQKDLLERSDSEEIISVKDNWLIAGRITKTEGDMTVQRNWLYGINSGKYALIINFAYRNTPISTLLIPGTIIEAELVYSPSHAPLRAFVKEQGGLKNDFIELSVSVSGWKEMCVDFARRLSRNPWADDEPYFIQNVKLIRFKSSWHLQDDEGYLVSVNPGFDEQKIFSVLALTGGKKMNLFLLKTGSTVFPLGINKNTAYHLI